MNLYHYRSVKNALLEIENGTFRFSSPSDVNDPLDGYANVYWQGDAYAWAGLFSNYICSLYRVIELYLLAADDTELRESTVLIDINCYNDVPQGKLLKNLSNDFINDDDVQRLILFYSTDRKTCSEEDLECLLRVLHNKAVRMCLEKLSSIGCVPSGEVEKVCPQRDTSSVFLSELHRWHEDYPDRSILPKINAVMQDAFERHALANRFADHNPLTDDESQRVKWLWIYVDYPAEYVKEILHLIFPEGYMVCFSGRSDNSVMWGNYAEEHKGVCLVYNTYLHNGEEVISLQRRSGYYTPHKVRPIQYTGTPVSRNFYESLGQLPLYVVESWLSGAKGTSEILSSYTNAENGWRDNYWAAYTDKFFHKLPDWQYEDEYRILIPDMLGDLANPADRYIPYHPDSLTGVIFGTKTTMESKYMIISALRKKGVCCDFFQAEYDYSMQKITICKKHYHLDSNGQILFMEIPLVKE